jgi:hypothetical protein
MLNVEMLKSKTVFTGLVIIGITVLAAMEIMDVETYLYAAGGLLGLQNIFQRLGTEKVKEKTEAVLKQETKTEVDELVDQINQA